MLLKFLKKLEMILIIGRCKWMLCKLRIYYTETVTLIALAVDRTVDRTSGRSTGTVDRCARDVHKGLPIRPVDRVVDRLKAPHSRVGAGQPMALARSTGRAFLPFLGCQRADF